MPFVWPSLCFLGGPKPWALGNPTFGLFLSFILFYFFLLCREMIVGKANKKWTMEGFSEYFSLLSGAAGGFFFICLHTIMQNMISCDSCIAGYATTGIKYM